jgi:HTH-type transcriptional regulator/antitoxin HigA
MNKATQKKPYACVKDCEKWAWFRREAQVFEAIVYMVEPLPIRTETETDYRAALDEIERLFDAELNTPEFDRLEVLTKLVEAYEQKHYPIAAPDPIEAILYYIESRGLSVNDLEPIIES